MMDNRKNGALFIIIIYLLVRMFGIFFLQANGLNYIFVPVLLFFLYKMQTFPKIKKWLLLYVFCVFVSCISSWILHKQNVVRCFVNSYDYLGILGFCIPAYFRISALSMKKYLKVMAVIFCLCYLIQWLIYPHLIWGSSSNVTDEIYRMRLPGCILSYFLVYCSFNDFLYTKKKINLILCCLAFFPIIIMGFRSLTILVLISLFLYPMFAMRKFGMVIKASILFGIFAICLSQTSIVQSKIEEMSSRTETGGTYADDDYVRYLEYDYLTSNVFTDKVANFVGNGTPVLGGNRYADSIVNAQTLSGVYWVDLGLVGLSFLIGIPAILLLVFLIIRSIWINRNRETQFYRFVLLTALIPSLFTLMEVFRSGNMLIIGLIIYTIEQEKSNKFLIS